MKRKLLLVKECIKDWEAGKLNTYSATVVIIILFGPKKMGNLRRVLYELNILKVPREKCDCDFPVKGTVSELHLTYFCKMCNKLIPLEWAENYKTD